MSTSYMKQSLPKYMKRSLPPMNALKVFEEAAKHDCFRIAADRLCVTQSAVSKQIQRLEESLETALFNRKRSGVVLTNAGREYYNSIKVAMDIIEDASEKHNSNKRLETLSISVPHSMGSYWLNERIQGFRLKQPQTVLQIESQHGDHISNNNESDLSIKCLPCDSGSAQKLERLFEEKVVLIAHHNLIKNDKGFTHSDLKKQALIYCKKRPGLWERFFMTQGISAPMQARQYGYDHFHMIIGAVEQNLGIGFIPHYLCSANKQENKFRELYTGYIKTGFGYYLDIPQHKRSVTKVVQFVDWIKEEIAIIS